MSLYDPTDPFAQTVQRQANLSARVRLITTLNPYMASQPAAVMTLANSSLSPSQLQDQSAGLFGAMTADTMAQTLTGLNPASQRAVFARMSTAQRQAMSTMGLTPPAEADSPSWYMHALGTGIHAVGAVVPDVVGEVARPLLEGISWAGQQATHLYRAVRTMDDTSQWESLLGAGLGIGLLIATGGTSALVEAGVGSLGMLGAYGLSAAGGTVASQIIHPGDFAHAWSASSNGERTFDRPSLARANELLGDPRLVNMAKVFADSGISITDMAKDIAEVDGDVNKTFGALSEIAATVAPPNTPEHNQVLSNLLTISREPVFQQAVVALRHGKISFGRDVADQLLPGGPGGGFYDFVSGITDAAFTVAMDPTLMVGHAFKVYGAAARGIDFADHVLTATRVRAMSEGTLSVMGFKSQAVRRRYELLAELLRTDQATRFTQVAPDLTQSWDPMRAQMKDMWLSGAAPEGVFGRKEFTDMILNQQHLSQYMRGLGTVRGAADVTTVVLKGYTKTSEGFRAFADALRSANHGILSVQGEAMQAKAAKLADEASKTLRGEAASQAILESEVLTPNHLKVLTQDGALIRPWITAEANQTTAAIGRGVAEAIDHVPGGTRILGTVAHVLERISTMAAAGKATEMVGKNAAGDIRAIVKSGGFLGQMPWQQKLWYDAIMSVPDGGQRMFLLTGWMDNVLTLSGIRDLPEGAGFVDSVLKSMNHSFGGGTEGLQHVLNEWKMTGLWPSDMATVMIMPNIDELRKAVQTTLLSRAVGIADAPRIEWVINSLWKPSVLLRPGFIVRAAGEERLNFLIRGGIGSALQESGGRSIAQYRAWLEVDELMAHGASLTPAQQRIWVQGGVPAHVRGVVNLLSRASWDRPAHTMLDRYSAWFRRLEEKGIGHAIPTVEKMARGEGVILSRQEMAAHVKNSMNVILGGTENSWRRMAAGGVNSHLIDSAMAFETRFFTTLMRELSATGPAAPAELGGRDRVLTYLEADANGVMRQATYKNLRGQFRHLDSTDPHFRNGVLYQASHAMEDKHQAEVLTHHLPNVFPAGSSPEQTFALLDQYNRTMKGSPRILLDATMGANADRNEVTIVVQNLKRVDPAMGEYVGDMLRVTQDGVSYHDIHEVIAAYYREHPTEGDRIFLMGLADGAQLAQEFERLSVGDIRSHAAAFVTAKSRQGISGSDYRAFAEFKAKDAATAAEVAEIDAQARRASALSAQLGTQIRQEHEIVAEHTLALHDPMAEVAVSREEHAALMAQEQARADEALGRTQRHADQLHDWNRWGTDTLQSNFDQNLYHIQTLIDDLGDQGLANLHDAERVYEAQTRASKYELDRYSATMDEFADASDIPAEMHTMHAELTKRYERDAEASRRIAERIEVRSKYDDPLEFYASDGGAQPATREDFIANMQATMERQQSEARARLHEQHIRLKYDLVRARQEHHEAQTAYHELQNALSPAENTHVQALQLARARIHELQARQLTTEIERADHWTARQALELTPNELAVRARVSRAKYSTNFADIEDDMAEDFYAMLATSGEQSRTTESLRSVDTENFAGELGHSTPLFEPNQVRLFAVTPFSPATNLQTILATAQNQEVIAANLDTIKALIADTAKGNIDGGSVHVVTNPVLARELNKINDVLRFSDESEYLSVKFNRAVLDVGETGPHADAMPVHIVERGTKDRPQPEVKAFRIPEEYLRNGRAEQFHPQNHRNEALMERARALVKDTRRTSTARTTEGWVPRFARIDDRPTRIDRMHNRVSKILDRGPTGEFNSAIEWTPDELSRQAVFHTDRHDVVAAFSHEADADIYLDALANGKLHELSDEQLDNFAGSIHDARQDYIHDHQYDDYDSEGVYDGFRQAEKWIDKAQSMRDQGAELVGVPAGHVPMVHTKNLNGNTVPVPEGEVHYDNAFQGLYTNERGEPISLGDPTYWNRHELNLDPGGEVMWPLMGDVVRDGVDMLANRNRFIPKTQYRYRFGDIEESGESILAKRAKLSNVDAVGADRLPNTAAFLDLQAGRKENLWDRTKSFGFDRVIGPSIDAMARKPMAFHFFQMRYRENMKAISWLMNPVYKSDLAKLADRLLLNKDVEDIKDVARHMRTLGHWDEANPVALRWTDQESLAHLRGMPDNEIKALVRRARATGDPKLMNAANGIGQRGLSGLAEIALPGMDAPEFLSMVAAHLPKDALEHLDNLEHYRHIIEADPFLARFGDDDWRLVVDAQKNLNHMKQAAGDYAAESAINDMMPFIDSHELRTQFADHAKGFLPFWYAEENFMKRWARTVMLDVSSIRKAQLGYMGMKHAGIIRTDPSGRDWFVYPGSSLVADVINKFGGWTGHEGIGDGIGAMMQSPTDTMLPGLNSRFGTPQVSPMVGLPMEFLGLINPEIAPVKRAIMGDYSASRPMLAQFLPSALYNLGDAMTADSEGASRYSSAQLAAIAHLQAGPHALRPDADAWATEEYLRKVGNHARVIAVAQGIAGWFTPGPPGAIGDSANSSIWGGDLRDPRQILSKLYSDMVTKFGIEQGTLEYLAEVPMAGLTDIVNPMAYTTGQTESKSGAPLPATEQALAFYDTHSTYMRMFPDASPWLLPQDPTGQGVHSQYAYDQQTINGLRQRRTAREFLTAVMFKEGSGLYFATKDEYTKAHDKVTLEGNTKLAREMTQLWLSWATIYKTAHPVFAEQLEGSDSRTSRKRVLDQMRYIVDDPGAPKPDHFEDIVRVLKGFDTYNAALTELAAANTHKAAVQRQELMQRWGNWLTSYASSTPSTAAFIQSIVYPSSGL